MKTQTEELYSRFAQGNFQREIRLLNSSGIAGHVFTTGEGIIVHDAYSDPRFARSIDVIICKPIPQAKIGMGCG